MPLSNFLPRPLCPTPTPTHDYAWNASLIARDTKQLCARGRAKVQKFLGPQSPPPGSIRAFIEKAKKERDEYIKPSLTTKVKHTVLSKLDATKSALKSLAQDFAITKQPTKPRKIKNISGPVVPNLNDTLRERVKTFNDSRPKPLIQEQEERWLNRGLVIVLDQLLHVCPVPAADLTEEDKPDYRFYSAGIFGPSSPPPENDPVVSKMPADPYSAPLTMDTSRFDSGYDAEPEKASPMMQALSFWVTLAAVLRCDGQEHKAIAKDLQDLLAALLPGQDLHEILVRAGDPSIRLTDDEKDVLRKSFGDALHFEVELIFSPCT